MHACYLLYHAFWYISNLWQVGRVLFVLSAASAHDRPPRNPPPPLPPHRSLTITRVLSPSFLLSRACILSPYPDSCPTVGLSLSRSRESCSGADWGSSLLGPGGLDEAVPQHVRSALTERRYSEVHDRYFPPGAETSGRGVVGGVQDGGPGLHSAVGRVPPLPLGE